MSIFKKTRKIRDMGTGEIKKIISSRLRAARENKNFTQSDMAEILKMERPSYTQIEVGRNMLTVENLVRLSDELGISVGYFLGRGTENLSSDEVELIELYRSLPDNDARGIALKLMRGWRDQARQARTT